MKSTVERLSPTRVKINVEVPFDELKPNFDRAYRKLAQQVQIKGFRPGKAPARVLEARVGRSTVLEEVVNEALPAKYSEAVSAEEVRPLGRPEFEVTKLEDGEQLAFTAEVDVRPTIELPDASRIAVEVDEVTVSDADVERDLDGLRTRFGTLTGVDRPAEKDDFVVVDLSATVDGKSVEEAATTGLSYQVGSGGLVEGIDEALVGLSAEESKTFTTMLVAGEYAEREAEVTVTVTAVKKRELPEADDEFAQLASEFDTLDELRADLSARLGRSRRLHQAVQAREKALEALVDAVEVPLPGSVLSAEVEVREHDALHAFDHDEKRFAAWLVEQGRSREEFDTELRTDAERAVKTHLVLDAVADVEEIRVSETELTHQVIAQAQRVRISPEEFLRRTQQAGQLGAIYADVRRNKALATLLRQVTVTDAAGGPVDLAEFLTDETDETDEAGETGEAASPDERTDADEGADELAERAETERREPAESTS